MEKLASVKKCPKCKGAVFTPTFNDFTGKRKYVPAISNIDRDCVVVPEHLEVTCSDCGFTWQEECGDVI